MGDNHGINFLDFAYFFFCYSNIILKFSHSLTIYFSAGGGGRTPVSGGGGGRTSFCDGKVF